MSERIAIGGLKPGMVLAETVLKNNSSKREGLSAGTKLSEAHIAAIKAWGISSVAVELDNIDQPHTDTAVRRVKERMLWTPSHPMEQEIYTVALLRAEDLVSAEKKRE